MNKKIVLAVLMILTTLLISGCSKDLEDLSLEVSNIKKVNNIENVLKDYDSVNIDMTYNGNDSTKQSSKVFNAEKNGDSYNITEKLSDSYSIYFYNENVYVNSVSVCYYDEDYNDIIKPYLEDKEGYYGLCYTSMYYENVQPYYEESYHFLNSYDIDEHLTKKLDDGYNYTYKISVTDELKKDLSEYDLSDDSQLVINYVTDKDNHLLKNKMSVLKGQKEKQIYNKEYTYNEKYSYPDEVTALDKSEKYDITAYENYGTDNVQMKTFKAAKGAYLTFTSSNGSKAFYSDEDYAVPIEEGNIMQLNGNSNIFVADTNKVESGAFNVIKKTSNTFANNYSKSYGKLSYINNMIKNYYYGDVDTKEMEENLYKGLLAGLGDKYAQYYTKEEYKKLIEKDNGKYSGIGAVLSKNADTGIISIIYTYDNSPASKIGIVAGDVLYSVDGKAVTGEDISNVAADMKGDAGTNVNIGVIHEDDEEITEMEVTRADIEMPTVAHDMLDDTTGYIQVVEFDKVTVEQFEKAVKDLKKQGADAIVIDLRNNPGGMLTSVCQMLDDLLSEGMLVKTDNKMYGEKEYNADKDVIYSGDLAVLINSNSASSSEIFAGSLQDHKAAVIVGTKSYGKGIIQNVFTLPDGSGMKFTIGEYYLPSGRSIHEKGVKPDIEVELDENLLGQSVITKQEDNQLQTAINALEN